MAEYPRNALMEQPIDPQFYRFQGSNALMGPIVTPDSRAGRTPDSYGGMGNQAPLPQDPLTPAYEMVSPMVAGYGAGQMASYARDAFRDGDYGTATGAGLMSAMGLFPMWGKKKGASAPAASVEKPTSVTAFHGGADFNEFKTPSFLSPLEAEAQSYRDFGGMGAGSNFNGAWTPKPEGYKGSLYEVKLPTPDKDYKLRYDDSFHDGQHAAIAEAQAAGHKVISFNDGREFVLLDPSAAQIIKKNGQEFTPPQNSLMDQPTGIRAYHGSPHDFEKFDISKIGTGEGAQAYGHGLYFAEHEDVAKGYRDTLAKSLINIDGVRKSVGDLMAHEETAANRIMQAGSAEKAKALPGVDALAQRDIDNLVQRGFRADPGRMYEVNIKADPEHFLDWDKPLSQQSEKVRNAWNNIAQSPEADKAAQEFYSYKPGMKLSDLPEFKEPYGSTIYRQTPGSVEAANAKLQEQGIPGIRYLDQGSRGAGEGSRNYVVFDPATIEIMRKYGLLGPMAGGVGMNALYGNNDQ